MLAYLFVVFAVAFRFLLLHSPAWMAFTPVAAALLYFGARAPRRQFWVPVALLAASDIVLTKLVYSYPLTADHFVTWGWYVAALFIGTSLRSDSKALRIGIASVSASVSFFMVSNFAVWAVWNMYPKTLGGLVDCYVAAVPFFRNTLAGDLFFSAVLFGIGAVVSGYVSEKAHGRIAA